MPSLLVGIGETVHRAAVDIHLPIHIGLAQLILQRRDFFRRLKRIVRAVTDQHLAFDVLGVAGFGVSARRGN